VLGLVLGTVGRSVLKKAFENSVKAIEARNNCAAARAASATMVKDATADYSDVEMHAALDVNIPNYASAIVTADKILEAISSL